MNVIVDTSIWSLALRRLQPVDLAHAELLRLVRHGQVQMLGIIRQELLSGIRSRDRFDALRDELSVYSDLQVTSGDHEEAAAAFNTCRGHGVQGNVVDMLICALAIRHELSIYSSDRDFEAYARFIPIKLHKPANG